MRAIFEDREGNLWIGTDGAGLFRLKRRLFKSYGVSEGLGGRMVKSVTEDHGGRIWALNHSQVTWFAHGQPPGLNPTNLAISAAWCVLADRQGNIWIGSYGTGLYRYDRAGLFQFPKPDGRRTWIVSTLMQDRAGGIWAGGEEGLWRVEGQTIRSLAKPDSLAQWDVRALAEDSFGSLYVGLNGGGLLRYQSGAWTRWTTRDGLADNRVRSLFVDTENTVWIGTFGSGLNRLKDGKFFSFAAPQLRLPGVVASILEDGDTNIWMGSNRGIFRVPRRKLNEVADGRRGALTLVNYSKADGLGTVECTGGLQPAACKGSDGRLWFATINGLSVVDPARLTHNPHPPPVVIEEVLINGQVSERSIMKSEQPWRWQFCLIFRKQPGSGPSPRSCCWRAGRRPRDSLL